jgi:MazG family protein
MPGDPHPGWQHLLETVAALRAEDGCPWDRAQTLQSMRPYLLEEAHEVLETLDQGDPVALREELGDLLFNVVMLARIAEEAGLFTMDQVAGDIAQKMVVRHPHVFEPGEHGVEAGSVAAWEAAKAAKAAAGRSRLDGLPPTLPSLLHAFRAGEKAAQVGFDWADYDGARAVLDEELGELAEARVAQDPTAIAHEYGDVLLSAAQLGRFLGVSPEDALRMANGRFSRRFRHAEAGARDTGQVLADLSSSDLDALWRRAKEDE